MAAPPSLNLKDFECPICHEIFKDPVGLSCLHNFCRECLGGVRQLPSADSPDVTRPSSPQAVPRECFTDSLVHQPKVYEAEFCFPCPTCRKVAHGYLECRDLETDLKTLDAPCAHCNQPFVLCALTEHQERCPANPKKTISASDIKRIFNKDFLKQLSASQKEAFEKSRSEENRSTFRCPYCFAPNLPVEKLCEHIEENHLDEDAHRICPICASMPWGEKDRVSRNVYKHILERHRFDYNTYVDYGEDEETMMARAIEQSMLHT